MPELQLDHSRIYYEVHGSGFPVIAFAPGFLSSRIERWRTNPANPGKPQNFLDPIEALSDRFQIIALDIRNAGASRGAILPNDSWDAYVSDFTALVDHLGITKAHIMGACIGVTFAFALAQARPGLAQAIVLQNPIGKHGNEAAIKAELDDWEARVRHYPELDPANIPGFRKRLFENDFLFAVPRSFVAECGLPILLMPGDDTMHPKPVSDEIARLAPQTKVVTPWKGDGYKQVAMQQVRDFLIQHEPASQPALT